MHVLITRRMALNMQTGNQLRAIGHTPVSISLSEIVDTREEIPEKKFAAIVFTSQAAIEVLNTRPEDLARLLEQTCPVFCVGDETAFQAESSGFSRVYSANGSSAELLELIVSKQPEDSYPILYPAGVKRSGALEEKLAQTGIETETIEIYRSDPVFPAPEALKNAIQAASKGCGLLYSVESATHLFNLCESYNLSKSLNLRGFIAISANVAKAVEPLTTQPIFVAQKPNQTAMFDCIDRLSST